MSELDSSPIREPALSNREILSNTLSKEVPATVNHFITVLQSENFIDIDEKMGEISNTDRLDNIGQLDHLNNFLSEFGKKPNHLLIRVSQSDYNLGFYRINFGFGNKNIIDKNGEDQMSLIFRDAPDNKIKDELIESASLHGNSPEISLNYINLCPSIQVNTSHIYRKDNGQVVVDRKAGVSFSLIDISSKKQIVNAFGIRYTGTQPSLTPINYSGMTPEQFNLLQKAIVNTTTKKKF